MFKLIFSLFYPWVKAITFCAYNLYASSDQYQLRLKMGGSQYVMNMYVRYNIFDYWIKAFKENWLRIIFTPWVFLGHPDIIDFGEQNDNRNFWST